MWIQKASLLCSTPPPLQGCTTSLMPLYLTERKHCESTLWTGLRQHFCCSDVWSVFAYSPFLMTKLSIKHEKPWCINHKPNSWVCAEKTWVATEDVTKQHTQKKIKKFKATFPADWCQCFIKISGWTLRRAIQFSSRQSFMGHKQFTGSSPRNMCSWPDQSILLGRYLWGLVTATISVLLLFPHESYWFPAFRSTCGAKTWRMRGGRWGGCRIGKGSSAVSLAGIKGLGLETSQRDRVPETKDFWCVQSEGLGIVVFIVGRGTGPVLSLCFPEMTPSVSEASRSEGPLQGDTPIWCAICFCLQILCCALLVPNHERDLFCEWRQQLSISGCHRGFFFVCFDFLSFVPSCVPEVEFLVFRMMWAPRANPHDENRHPQMLQFRKGSKIWKKKKRGIKKQSSKSPWTNRPWWLHPKHSLTLPSTKFIFMS